MKMINKSTDNFAEFSLISSLGRARQEKLFVALKPLADLLQELFERAKLDKVKLTD